MKGYAAYPSIFQANRQVPRCCHPHGHERHPSASRTSSADLAVSPHIVSFRLHRRVPARSSRKSRYRRQESSRQKSERTGHCLRLPLSCLSAGIPTGFPPFRSPPQDYWCTLPEWGSPVCCTPHPRSWWCWTCILLALCRASGFSCNDSKV